MRKFIFVVLALLMISGLPAFAQDQTQGDIAVAIAADGRFTTLANAIQVAGLEGTLHSAGPYTFFAPTDDAFAAMPQGALDSLLADPDALKQTLLYHLVQGQYQAADVAAQQSLTSMQGSALNFRVDGTTVFVNDAQIIGADLTASNGVIYAINAPLTLPAAAAAGSATTHIRIANFSPDAPPLQIYIDGQPSDIQTVSSGEMSGWVEMPAGSYQLALVPDGSNLAEAVIPQQSYSLDAHQWQTIATIGSTADQTVTTEFVPENYAPLADGQARVTFFNALENGPAVNVVSNRVTTLASDLAFGVGTTINVPTGTTDVSLVPMDAPQAPLLNLPITVFDPNTFYFVAATGTTDAPQAQVFTVQESQVAQMIQESRLIPQVLQDSGHFTILLQAMETAGLTDTLSSGGPYTLFAPTDDAFNALPQDTLNSLLATPNQLKTVLLGYIVQGQFAGSDVAAMTSLTTLAGTTLTVSADANGVYLNGTAQLMTTDIATGNGVIHEINAVLLPQGQ
jgi:uncharacterized surface protein with fasciclin (FAS1) repeats